jgi:hypothetical protein
MQKQNCAQIAFAEKSRFRYRVEIGGKRRFTVLQPVIDVVRDRKCSLVEHRAKDRYVGGL